MSNETCILTAKDFSILEAMRDRCLGRDDPLAWLLRKKLELARVVTGEDIPANIATLSSRVTFSIDGRDPDTRILSTGGVSAPVGLSLSIATPRGLALLGLTEGDGFHLPSRGVGTVRVMLEKVQYQPEAARREKRSTAVSALPTGRRPMLKLVGGSLVDGPGSPAIGTGGFDDPGPSAA
jgi:regulator of nucleoside diphosphate kinase